MTEPRAQVVRWGSLCTADCEDGYHVPEFVKCDRCGSDIHFRVIEVADPQRGLVTVGSECIKPIMGWKWSKSHEQALAMQEMFDRVLVEQGTLVATIRKASATALVNVKLRDVLRIGKGSLIPVDGWVARIWRAAEDLGLPWFEGGRNGPDVIATSTSLVLGTVYNWTAKLPGGTALGGQTTDLYQAKTRLRAALGELRDRTSDYEPRGAIWEGVDELVVLATWRGFMGYQELPLSYMFA